MRRDGGYAERSQASGTGDVVSEDRTAVVVVDDEPPIVAVVCDVLHDEGFQTIRWMHGSEGFPCIQQKQPQPVILDIQMPGVDGIEVFQQMRAEPSTANIPVIFFTANSHILKERLPNYQELGATLLPKPFDIAKLIDLVEETLPS